MTETLNTERLLKLLALAESSEEGEALAAVRKAAAMARAAGKSLGQAVEEMSSPTMNLWPRTRRSTIDDEALQAAFKRGEDAGYMQGMRDAELAAKRRAQAKIDRDVQLQEARLKGEMEGRQKAEERFAQLDAYQMGYRAGFDAGQENERAATVSAYNRGRKDEAAQRDAQARRQSRTRRK